MMGIGSKVAARTQYRSSTVLLPINSRAAGWHCARTVPLLPSALTSILFYSFGVKHYTVHANALKLLRKPLYKKRTIELFKL